MTVSLLLAAQAALHSRIQACAIELGHDLSRPESTVKRGGAAVDVHAWRGRRLLWAPHPAARIPPGEWVDAVVEAASASAGETGCD